MLGPKRKFLALGMYISYFLCHFYLRWVANFQWNMGISISTDVVSETRMMYIENWVFIDTSIKPDTQGADITP